MATTYTPSEYRQSGGRADSMTRFFSRAITLNWYTVAYIAIFIVAVFTRFYALGDRVMSHDESLHTYYSWLLARNGDYVHTPMMHGPILFHATAFFYFIFGANDFTSRLYPAILGVLMVLFPLLFRRWLGRTGALIASLLVLISPLLMYHHRYIREDTPSIFFTIIMVWATFMYIDGPMHLRRKARWLYLFSGAMLASLASKEVAFMYIAIFGVILTVYWICRVIQYRFKRPTKTLFYFLTMPALLGGVVALIMYMVFSIALGAYPSLEGRLEFMSAQLRGLGSGTTSLDFSMFLNWTLLTVVGTLVVIAGTAVWAFRRNLTRLRWREVLLIFGLTVVLCVGLIIIEEVSHLPSRSEAIAADPDYDQIDTVAERSSPIIAAWVLSGLAIAIVAYIWRKGWVRKFYRFPEFDILIIMGSFIIPWGTGLFTYLTGASPRDQSPDGITRTLLVLIPFLAVMIFSGLVWNWKRWLISAIVFHVLFVFFFTTMFTNPGGLFTGMIGSLGYWLDQQGVRRGGQPQYYYQLIIMPIYEYLPIIGSFLAMLAGFTRFWSFRRDRLEEKNRDAYALAAEGAASDEVNTDAAIERMVEDNKRERQKALWGEGRLRRLSFPLFVSFWAIYIFIAYTLAGEKMPWLGTHLTLPMGFVAAWYFGRVFENTDWARFRSRGWLLLLLIPLFAVAVFQTIAPFLIGQNPFAGLQQAQLSQLNQWIAMLILIGVIGYLIYLVVRRVGWLHLRHMIGVAALVALSLLTFRTAWMASFINYDYATEYLVYAHGAPGIKLMMEQIEELSRRVSGGMSMRFAWGGNSWPVTWYFRDLTNQSFFAGNPTPDAVRDAVAVYASEDIRSRVEPLLEDRYYRFEYMRMWWPSWNYFNLNATRVANALDFSPSNTQAAEIRHGIWDIFWARDYSRYGRAVGEDYSPQNWNPGERLYFYVRKDIAAQVWNLGVGEGMALNPLDTAALQTVNVCTENWQPRRAQFSFTLPEEIRLSNPMDIDVSADGRVFVADEFNNRILEFTSQGQYVTSFTGLSGGSGFNRPNGVAAGLSGELIVADTWNYRVNVLDMMGNFARGWGQPVLEGAAVLTEPTDGFWGPRDVEVDLEGNIYVSDTGNKRIRVYAPDGTFLRDIGSAGANIGQLDEPSGIAISPDGRIFVADTWNRRVSVFSTDGVPLYVFNVRGWYETGASRPYLALDPARNLLYVTDPDAGRILVFDTQGNCVGSFGQPADRAVDTSQFQTVGGIAVDSQGFVYVTDSEAGRILKFDPFVELPQLSGVLEEVVSDFGDAPVGDGALPDQAMADLPGAGQAASSDAAAEQTEAVGSEATEALEGAG